MYLKNLIIVFLIFCSFIIITPSTFAAEKTLKLDIKTYLNNIRQEFKELSESKEKDELPLYIEKVHIELYVAYKWEAGGKVKFYVIDAGGKIGGERTQKLSFDVHFSDEPGGRLQVYRDPRAGWEYTGMPPDVMMAMDASFFQEILDRLKKIEEKLK